MKKLSETSVILNFLEDSKSAFRDIPDLGIEVPAGSWQGSRDRGIADIHAKSIPGIEAKGCFTDAKKDFINQNKNQGITHYIYASSSRKNSEDNFWRKNQVSACVYLTEKRKWCMMGRKDGVFDKIIRKELFV